MVYHTFSAYQIFYIFILKRTFDCVLSFFLLCMLSPLVIFYVFRQDLLFGQLRIGQHEKLFKIWKLKTMLDVYYTSGKILEDQDRTTKWGLWLRKYSLDELPQLWNILAGQMSFIGPRPLPKEYQSLLFENYPIRHQVKPGITGLAQIKGRNRLTWKQKFELDKQYVLEASITLDIKIFFQTLLYLLLKRDGDQNTEKLTAKDLK